MNVGIDPTQGRLVFGYNSKNARQCAIVDKYKDMPPEEFKKLLPPLLEKQKIVYKRRLKKFKQLKPSDFAKMPLKRKLQYVESVSGQKYSSEEWSKLFLEVKDNLRACLFTLQPSKKFLLEEKRDLNHFMNALFGVGLDKAIKETTQRNPEQRKQDMQDFLCVFCKVYKMPEPQLLFGEFNNPGAFNCMDEDRTCRYTVKIHENLLQDKKMNGVKNFGILFHELMHAREAYLQLFNGDKHPEFSWILDNLQKLINDFKFDLDIYSLLPKEGHAYYMQQKFEEQLNERVFGGHAEQYDYNFQNSRTLWYDYQER